MCKCKDQGEEKPTTCQHENIEYHKCCDKVVCNDCDKSWSAIIHVPVYIDRYVAIPTYEVIC